MMTLSKYRKGAAKAATMLLAATLLASCTDTWDEHYEPLNQSEGSLWQSICNNPNLSNFKEALQATGYDATLNGDQVFTVFAPTNDKFTTADLNDFLQKYNNDLQKGLKGKKNSAIKEFVQNHIALYNYSSSAQLPDTLIRMMNGKYQQYSNTSFANINYVTSNQAASNGILYTIADKAKYNSNVFEYISMDEDFQNVASFLYMKEPYQLHIEKFYPEESVPGDIKDGMQEYLDSVTITYNKVLDEWLYANLDNEDSTYYAVVPTNDVWDKLVSQNEKYFQYSSKVADRDSMMYFYPRVKVLEGMQFSATVNPKLGTTESIDSIMSPLATAYTYRQQLYGSYDKKYYQFDNPYAANGIFNGTTKIDCSNGVIYKADVWNAKPVNTFLQDLSQECEYSEYLDSLSGATQNAKPSWTTVNVSADNPFYGQVSNNSFNVLTSRTASAPFILFDLKDMLSNKKYDLYVVTAPAYAGDTLTTDTLPTKFQSTLYYNTMEGVEESISIDDTYGGEVVYDSRQRAYVAEVNPNIVDKIFLATIEVPACTYSLTETRHQVKLKIEVKVRDNKTTNEYYTKTLRLDRILLVPHEE